MPIGNLDSPFDVTIADNNNNRAAPRDHEEIAINVIAQVETQLSNANVYGSQKIRIGTIGNGNSPTSSYWNAAGQFDIVRYIVPQSVRELPVIRDAEAEAAMRLSRGDKSELAALISASM